MEMIHQAAPVQPTTLDETRRTVEVVFSTGAVVRQPIFEAGEFFMARTRIQVDDASIDLTMLNEGAPVLNGHMDFSAADTIGVVEEAWISEGTARARLRFAGTEDVEPVWQRVRDGILRQVSVGGEITSAEWTEDDGGRLYLITGFVPREISMVPLGADPGAVVQRRQAEGKAHGGRNMKPKQKQTIRQGASLAAALERAIEAAQSDDEDRRAVISRMAEAAGIESSTVTQILDGDINCPPLERLAGFAEALDVSQDDLVAAAERDGCSYEPRQTADQGAGAGQPVAQGAGQIERARIAQILDSVEAKGRGGLARHLALKTDMDVAQARSLLAAAATEAAAPAPAPRDVPAPSPVSPEPGEGADAAAMLTQSIKRKYG